MRPVIKAKEAQMMTHLILELLRILVGRRILWKHLQVATLVYVERTISH